ncbi:hypothetical protein LTR37_018831 [Vermiconidia calcicola]|uniref:Uncharacterized protein n=1 Tax=Vermiconidia calcicola TaxID=1690605 RepID=A0ACC3MG74_9PEZI|nr:hypothetical protein LTR37_018831 [Vermiconidia calcicola]
MAAMMPATSGGNQTANPYEHYDAPVEDDLIDPDDATLDELDDPVNQSDRAPLTGRITNNQAQSNTRAAGNTQGYLNSAIPGEDRRAPLNTIDETVWETLRRDLLAVWEKMKQVLYPKYLFGGVMNGGAGIAGDQDGENEGLVGGAAGTLGHIRSVVGRWPDADAVLQGGMSEGLRDWDLWGPLLFCLLLSFLLSWNARDDQRSLVFSGVFAMIWIAEAVVTLQIKLLGGNILSPAVHVTLAINELPVQRNMKGVTTASNNVDCIWQSPAFDITARELCALIANGESVEVLKEKWHDSEQRLVKIYELRAKDIVRLLPSWVRRQSAKLPDLVIKTFKASDCNQQANQAACWELAALKKLRRLSCEHTPTLTHTFSFIQDDSRVVAVVMQKIKGITLSDAWESMSARTKTKVRKAFKIARHSRLRNLQGSPALRNVTYNATENKCYIIDFERARFGCVSRNKLRCPRWGLKKPKRCSTCSSREGCDCARWSSGINYSDLFGDEE